MKTLVFTVGWADLYFELACMFAHSCRKFGYEQDLIIFSSTDGSSKHATVVNVSTHTDADTLRTGSGNAFHGRIPKRLGYQKYGGELDYFMIKTLPGRFVNRDKYDFILYCDSDILVRRSLRPIFCADTLVSGYNGFSYHRAMKRLAAHLTPEEVSEARRLPCIGSGVIGVPRPLYGFFDDFRRAYLTHLHEIPHDGPAVQLAGFRGRNTYKPVQLNRNYFSHYWGPATRKQRMIEDYRRMFSSEGVAVRDHPTAFSAPSEI